MNMENEALASRGWQRMSLIGQLWGVLLLTVAVGLASSVVVTVASARAYLQTELRVKNSDYAQALALTLSHQGGDVALAELAIAAQFDTGFYAHMRLVGVDGRTLVDRRAPPREPGAPLWFMRAAPIASVPGVAQVSDGWRALGTLEVESDASFAYAELWRASSRMAAVLLAMGLVACVLGSMVIARIRKPLQGAVEQARALVERRFVHVEEPAVPELRELGRAMNTLVQRLKTMLEEQGLQIESLRRAAQSDPLTGLAHRTHFMARLASLAGREDAPASGTLVLLRVRDLAGENRLRGHADTNALLVALGDCLRRVSEAGAHGVAGRLNGSDFALLTTDAHAGDAARALQVAVRLALAPWPHTSVATGAVQWQRQLPAGTQLAGADAALMRAEAQGDFGLSIDAALQPSSAGAGAGEQQWRRQVLHALEQRHAALGAYPVVDRAGALLHLEAPLRLCLAEGGPLEPAAQWLPWALRSGLTAQADLLAVQLALELIERDGRARGINLAPASLADSGFVPRLRERLQAHGAAAKSLWVEVGEQAALEQLPLVRELARAVRPLGVKLGLEHAGWRLARVERLYEAGLDYVKLDASLSHELAGDRARADFLRGLVSTLHGLGASVYAEGVQNAATAEALWDCGVDGVTGPWAGQAPS